MDAELLSRARIQDTEREIGRIRLAAAAERARSDGREAVPEPRPHTAPTMPERLLRAFRFAP